MNFGFMERIKNYFSYDGEKKRLIAAITKICKKKGEPVPEQLEERTLRAVRDIYKEKVKSLTLRDLF